MEKLELLKHQKWVVAVSGGGDSLALLHMCKQAGINIVCAHVNYQKRESADRDMYGVKAYCDTWHIPCFVHVVNTYEKHTNFQAQAREIRYRFFKEVVEKESAEGVLVAHHKDDVLETYFMQKEAGRIPMHYGIAEEVSLYNVRIKRPLLKYTKKELEQYCQVHDITYFEDESNLSDIYTRNRIRHERIDTMSEEEKEKWTHVIVEENEKLQRQQAYVDSFLLNHKDGISIETLLREDTFIQKLILRKYLLNESGAIDVSGVMIEDLLRVIKTHKTTNIRHTIEDAFIVCIEYGVVYVLQNIDVSYAYKLDEIEYIETPYFKLAKEGKTIEMVSVNVEDFPLTIRSAKPEDCIQLRLGKKKVNRFFIDRKIPYKQRRLWPVIENKEGNVIFVSGIGCDIYHYSNNSSFFVLK